MDHTTIYMLYVVNVALIGGIIFDILRKRTFSAHYVYFVAVSSFAVLNLLGSATGNIIATGQGLPLQTSLFATTVALAFLYPVLAALRSRNRASVALKASALETIRASQCLKVYVISLLLMAVAGVVTFSVIAMPPLLFRVDLYGQWTALIELRSEATFGGHKFHWFALVFFDVPLFATIVSSLCWWSHDEFGQVREARAWRRLAVTATVLGGVLSVSFLHKTFFAYFVIGIFLTGAVLSGNVLRRGVKFGAFLISGASVLYLVYLGFSQEALPYVAPLLIHRIFEVYPWAAAVTLELFQSQADYLGGTSFTNPSGLFPYEQVSLARMIFPHIYGSFKTGSAPAPSAYELYANCGWSGFVLGILVCVGYVLVMTRFSWSTKPVLVALSIFLTIKAISLWQTALWFGALQPPVILLVLMLWMFWVVLKSIMLENRLRRVA